MLFNNFLGAFAVLGLTAAGTAFADTQAAFSSENSTSASQWNLNLNSLCDNFAGQASGVNSSFPWKEVCSHLTNEQPYFNATVQELLFTSALPSSLQDFLDQYSINFNVSAASPTLQGLMKLNYDAIRKNINTFDAKPFEAFFNNYNVEGLQNWISEHGIYVSNKAQNDKRKLIKAIVAFIHQNLTRMETEKYNILDSLDLFQKNIFDANYNISTDIFSQFSANELNKWLNLHNIPLSANLTESRDYLSQRAQEHFSLLQDDIEWYLLRYKTMASPFIGKTPEQVAFTWNGLSDLLDAGKEHAAKHLNNETLANIGSWSNEKLESFIELLNSKKPANASIAEMIQDFGRNLTSSLDQMEWNFAGNNSISDSINSFKDWASNTSSQVMDSDLYNDLNSKVKSLGDNVGIKARELNEFMDNMFQSWSVEDLKTYVNKVQDQFTAEPVKEESLVDKAKSYTRKLFGYEPEPETKPQKCMDKIKQYANELYHAIMPAH